MKRLFAIVLAALVPSFASAQCQNAVSIGCGVYSSCFAKYCICPEGPDEYFNSYGAKYCKAFIDTNGFSAQGKTWRDSTLVCLQEAIVPELDISESPKCNCSKMKAHAYRSHVTCYTQTKASICALPVADLALIGKTVDIKDMFDSAGWKQMHEVSKVCAVTAPDDGRRATWKSIESVLELR